MHPQLLSPDMRERMPAKHVVRLVIGIVDSLNPFDIHTSCTVEGPALLIGR